MDENIETTKKRVGNISFEQKNLLIEFMERNPKLVKGKFTAEFNHKTGQKLWVEIASILNAAPGANKEWRQWRKTWQDMRNKSKILKVAAVRNLRSTGVRLTEKHKLSVPSRRFERSLKQSDDSVPLSQSDLQMRQTYYDAKIRLLERQVESQEFIAAVKERHVEAQERIAVAQERQAAAQERIAAAKERQVNAQI